MANKFINVEVGIDLYNHIKNHTVFLGENYKIISPTYYFLVRISMEAREEEDWYAPFTSQRLKSLFKAYGCSYNDVLAALEELGLILPRIKGFFDRTGSGKSRCARFKLTELGQDLVARSETEYLRKLHADPILRRRSQKRRSKNKLSALEEVKTGLEGRIQRTLFELQYDREAIAPLLEDQSLTKHEKICLTHSLANFEEGNLRVSRGEKDGRLHHSWVQLKKEARPFFTLKGRRYTHTIDIRACHPTFFGQYIGDFAWNTLAFAKARLRNDENFEKSYFLFKESCILNNIKLNLWYDSNIYIDSNINIKDISNNYIFISSSSSISHILHYLVENGDNLAAEIKNWNDFWTQEEDPRKIIAAELGAKTDKRIKGSINSAINGSNNMMSKWIAKTYPQLSSIWSKTKLDVTGNQISRFYESKLMLNPTIYDVAEHLDLQILSEHDGVGVFSKDGEYSSLEKCRTLVAYIVAASQKKFGLKVRLAIKISDVGG